MLPQKKNEVHFEEGWCTSEGQIWESDMFLYLNLVNTEPLWTFSDNNEEGLLQKNLTLYVI